MNNELETSADYLKVALYCSTVENITVGKFREIMSEHKYIIVRHEDGDLVGINCAITTILDKRPHPNNQYTRYYSWRVCSFHEYLNYKTPFCRK